MEQHTESMPGSSGGENSGASYSMKLRSRRNPLTDISNTIAQKITNMTQKVISTNKKRKLTAEEQEAEAASQEISVEISSSASPSNVSSSSNNLLDLMEMVSNPAAMPVPTKKLKSREDKDSNFYGYSVPQRIKRKIPLQGRSADPCQCYEVLDDMYGIYDSLQELYTPKSIYSRQTEITSKMRTILVDWIVEVHYKYKLQPPTLWLCINILDRFLEKVDIPRNRLQLVGITSLFIACKFEEVNAPEVRDCVYLTDNAYQRSDVLQMETSILTALDFQLMVPTGYHFLTRFLNRLRANERVRLIASYTAERNLQESDIFFYNAKVYAAAAVYVAMRTVHMDNPDVCCWTPALEEESGLKEQDLISCARSMAFHNAEQPMSSTRRKLEAARKKYGNKAMQFISTIPYPTL